VTGSTPILVTGAAGFIGAAVSIRLIEAGERVIGVDNFNPYYDTDLKTYRAEQIARHGTADQFRMIKADISEPDLFPALLNGPDAPRRIVHLAAQAGVRASLDTPRTYIRSNIDGFLNVLEAARFSDRLEHVIYASSSSVYGGNTKTPFAPEDRVDDPVSLYAATKRSNELMARVYADLFALPLTGLRFFTVYGPMGRPDMAPWMFMQAALAGQPIRVYGDGEQERDFTYIDDIVEGVLGALNTPPQHDQIISAGRALGTGQLANRLYNLGNNTPVTVNTFIATMERVIGQPIARQPVARQPGDVMRTCADITASQADFGFAPRIDLEEGLSRFHRWFRDWKAR